MLWEFRNQDHEFAKVDWSFLENITTENFIFVNFVVKQGAENTNILEINIIEIVLSVIYNLQTTNYN